MAALPLASPAADLGLAKDFNAFVFGNYAAASDSEGAVAVGGDFTGSQNNGMHINPGQAPAGRLGGATDIGLYVGGTFNAGVNGNTKATAYLNGKIGGSVNNSPTVLKDAGNAPLFASMASDFAATRENLKAQSNAIGALAVGAGVIDIGAIDYSDQNHTMLNGVDLGTRNNLTFNVQSFAKKGVFDGVSVYVFNVTDAGMSRLALYNPILRFDGLDATHTLLLNFTGASVDFTPQIQTNSSNRYTLYNFQNATAVSAGANAFTGSILAPKAKVTQGGNNIQGNVIADGFVQGGELHYDAGDGVFRGWVPPAAPVPEPASMIALGVGTIATLRRRRKRA